MRMNVCVDCIHKIQKVPACTGPVATSVQVNSGKNRIF